MNNNSEARHLIDGVSVFCAFDEIVEIDKLKENPKNPNTHPSVQIDLLAQIIKKTGWRAPITVSNLSGFIVKGHGRLQAAKAAGFKHCPVEYQNFTDEEEEMAALLADNKLAELAEIDVEKLTEIFKDYEFEDLSLTGYSQAEFDELVEVFEEAELLCDPDEVPEEVETRCKLGDIWQLGNHRLMCGDSTSKADVETLMNGDKADMVFTDPPYNIDYSGIKDKRTIKNDKMSDEDFVEFLSSALIPCETSYICCSWQYEHLFKKAMERVGIPPKAMIIWNKVNPAQNLDKYYKQHEIIFYHGKFGGEKTLRGDIWECKRQKNTVHPTMKPIELITMALQDQPNKNIVYDGFGGSGSTLIACEQENRCCRMMELDPHYCDVIITRWETLTGKKAELIT